MGAAAAKAVPAARPARPVAIVAGAGRLPLLIAAALEGAGRSCRVLAIRGFADPATRRRADATVDLLDVRGALDTLCAWAPAGVTLAGPWRGRARPPSSTRSPPIATARRFARWPRAATTTCCAACWRSSKNTDCRCSACATSRRADGAAGPLRHPRARRGIGGLGRGRPGLARQPVAARCGTSRRGGEPAGAGGRGAGGHRPDARPRAGARPPPPRPRAARPPGWCW